MQGTTLTLLPDHSFTLYQKKVTFNPNCIRDFKIACYGEKISYKGTYTVEKVGTAVKVAFTVTEKTSDLNELEGSSNVVNTQKNLSQ